MRNKRKGLAGFLCFLMAAGLAAGSVDVGAQSSISAANVLYHSSKTEAKMDMEEKTRQETSSNYNYSILANGTVQIEGYLGKENAIVIPSEIEGKK